MKLKDVIILVLIGAIGAGIWQYLINPIFDAISNIGLNLLTFGLKSLQDNIYSSIGRGLHERFSNLIFTGIAIFMFLYLCTIDNAFKSKSSFETKFMRYFLIITITVLLFGSLRDLYINKKITDYNQLYDTIAPFIDEEERLTINSQFAQIRQKGDYDLLMQHLEDIAMENNQKLPV